MAAIIGALRVVIGADSAALVSDLDRARGKVSGFGSDMAKVGAAIGVALTAAYASVSLGVANTISQMSDLAKQSQKIGIPVETLSALKLAADESGVGVEQLTKGVGKLSKAMVEAAAKPASAAADAFKALGVSVTDTDGKLRPTTDVMLSMAGKFEGLKDGAGKTAVSMALMGKTGFELIPMLNLGSSGLQQMMERAKQLGVTFDTDTANAAKKFQGTLIQLGAAKDGIIVKLTAYMLPALQQFADRMLAAATSSEKQQTKLAVLQGGFDILARAVLVVVDNFSLLLKVGAVFIGAQIGAAVISMGLAFVRLAAAIRATGIIMAAFDAVRAISMRGFLLIVGIVALLSGQFDNLTSSLKDVATKVESVMPAGVTDMLHKALDAMGIDLEALTNDLNNFADDGTAPATRKQTDFNYAVMGGKQALDSFLDSTKKAIAAQTAEAATVGLAAGEKEKLRVVMQGLEVATAAHIPITDALRAKLDALGLSAGQAALNLKGAQLVLENRTPAEAFQQDMANNTLAMEKFGATSEQIARMQEKAAEAIGMSWHQMGGSLAGSMATITAVFGKENKSMFKASQAFAVAQAILNAWSASSKAFATLPPPASYVAAAAALATGFATVAQIRAQKMPSFAMGADFKIPGGLGGGDKIPVSFMAEPGEQVTVQSNRDRRSNGATTINVNLRSVPFSRDREMLRDLIDGFNAMTADGYRLKVAPA